MDMVKSLKKWVMLELDMGHYDEVIEQQKSEFFKMDDWKDYINGKMFTEEAEIFHYSMGRDRINTMKEFLQDVVGLGSSMDKLSSDQVEELFQLLKTEAEQWMKNTSHLSGTWELRVTNRVVKLLYHEDISHMMK